MKATYGEPSNGAGAGLAAQKRRGVGRKAARPRRRGPRVGGQGAQRRAGGLPPEPPCVSMGLFFADAKYNRLDLTFL